MCAENALWILSECSLHCGREFYRHILYAPAERFHCNELTADNVCAARACHNACYAAGTSLRKAVVKRVYAVNRAQFGSYGFIRIIAVRTLESYAVLPHADMAMCIHKPGKYKTSADIYLFRIRIIKIHAHCMNLSVFNCNIPLVGFSDHRNYFPFLIFPLFSFLLIYSHEIGIKINCGVP